MTTAPRSAPDRSTGRAVSAPARAGGAAWPCPRVGTTTVRQAIAHAALAPRPAGIKQWAVAIDSSFAWDESRQRRREPKVAYATCRASGRSLRCEAAPGGVNVHPVSSRSPLRPDASAAALRPFAFASPGIRAMAIGAFWFSIMSLLVKLVGRRIPSMEVVFFRSVLTLGMTWVALRAAGVSPLGTQRRLLVLRGVLGSIALSCFFFSLVHLPLGEATLIQYMNPVFATVLAAIFLAERLRAAEAVCLVASLLGVLFIARPDALFGAAAAPIDPLHIGIALAGAAFSGAGYAVVRKIGTAEHSLVVVLYLPLLSVPLSLPFAAADWRWPTPMEWLLLAGIGVTTQLAQMSMTRGLQLETTARATTTGYLQIVFAVVLGALVLGDLPDAWTVAGATTIIGSTLVLAHARRPAEVPPDE